jgi:hypothetical protein
MMYIDKLDWFRVSAVIVKLNIGVACPIFWHSSAIMETS